MAKILRLQNILDFYFYQLLVMEASHISLAALIPVSFNVSYKCVFHFLIQEFCLARLEREVQIHRI